MLSRLILASAFIFLLVGCGKHPETSPSGPASPAESSPGQTATVAPGTEQARVAGGSETELAAALAELTQALRKYSFEHQRLPKTLSEVIAAGYVKTMPQAPPGKKFEIDPKKVQVTVVKQ